MKYSELLYWARRGIMEKWDKLYDKKTENPESADILTLFNEIDSKYDEILNLIATEREKEGSDNV